MASKRITPKLILILITIAAVIGLAVFYYLRYVSNTYYFVGLKTVQCEVDKTSSQCNLHVIHTQTVTGDDVYFYYDKSKLIIDDGSGQLTGFTPNEKVQVTIIDSSKNISKIRAVN